MVLATLYWNSPYRAEFYALFVQCAYHPWCERFGFSIRIFCGHICLMDFKPFQDGDLT